MVLNPGLSGKEDGELVDELEFIALDDEFGPESVSDEDREAGNYFWALMGGSALREILKKLDTPALIDELTKVANESASTCKAEDALKRLRVLKMFDPRVEKKVPNKADWMILTVLPVTPPNYAPWCPWREAGLLLRT